MPDARQTMPRGLGIASLVVLLVGAAVALERWGWVGRLRALGGPERLWIWAEGDPRDARPVAFYALRDFALERVPGRATLTVLGDEEYVVALNGHRVGSNRYRAGARLDRYEVATLLAPGANRLLVELRSATGAGGFTLRLEDGEGHALAVSGPDWSIHRAYHRALLAGGRAPAGEAPRVLGRAPLGRWGRLEAGPERPLFESVLAVDAVVRPEALRTALDPVWAPPSPRGARGPSLGARVEFDFGAPRVGYLQLSVRGEEADSGLLRFGLEPARGDSAPDHLVVLPRGSGLWRDSVPRRFRYVEVIGLDRLTSAGLLALADDALASLGEEGAPPSLLGIQAPPLRAPAQDVVRRELEGAAELGVGERR